MSALIAIKSLLSGSTLITNEVGTKIYPQKASQNTPNPCIITNILTTNPTLTKRGTSVLDVIVVSIDVYADRNDEADRIASLVRMVLDGSTYSSGGYVVQRCTFLDSMGFTDAMADSYRVTQTYSLRVDLT